MSSHLDPFIAGIEEGLRKEEKQVPRAGAVERLLFPFRWVATSVFLADAPCARRWCGRRRVGFSKFCRRHTGEVLRRNTKQVDALGSPR